MGQTQTRLPIGIQIVGKPWRKIELFAIGSIYKLHL
ncbi:amidase [Symplocastrum sp. BBK-W-15]|uniref:Amidase n=1 Tax=Limnofasciculus baicalensis BBK-W-15 TaxID=2699891 RepID=A0AAE3GNN5_9CYAN|nr:amidase [Limnofasciculus baicalensis BBK-W-15]